ncbi:MAG: hypothetical protein ACLR2E_08220 [Lachnospiraceae bacterium]
MATINNNARTVVISGDELNKIKQSYGETPVSPQRNSVPNIPPVHKATAGAPGNGNPGYGGGYGNAYPPQGGRPAGQEAPTRPREIPIRRIISIPMRTRMRMASAEAGKIYDHQEASSSV